MGMQLIETIEVGSGGAASIEFTSIPQDGVDLVLVASARADNATYTKDHEFRINNDSSSVYDMIGLNKYSTSTVNSNSSSNLNRYARLRAAGGGATANTFSSSSLYISNYTSSAYKSISSETVTENNAAETYMILGAGLYKDTAAVTSLQLYLSSDNMVQYSTASLYKITAD